MSPSVLSRTLLAYEPVIDRARKAIAMRITARSADHDPVDVGALYGELAELWPAWSIPVVMRVAADTLPASLLEREPTKQVWLELPEPMTGSAHGLEVSGEFWRRGFVQVLGGVPVGGLPPELIPAFRMAVVHVEDDRRLKAGAVPPPAYLRSIPYAQDGVTSIALLERCFATGAEACIGWPFDDSAQHAKQTQANPDFSTITQLLAMIERDADAADLDKVIRRDAALAYRLLRYINSAAFGLTVEIQSFQHAVMMLGYERLKRWLLLMLVTASKDANMRPVMFASFRRGLFMEHLVGTDGDAAARDAVFILGVLSLLDKLFFEPMPMLLEKLHVAEAIREALIARTGPFAAYLGVAEAVEREPGPALASGLDRVLVSIEQCNRALVKAITVKEAMQS